MRLEQGIGLGIVGDFFVGQKADEPSLEEVEAAFDFAFGLSVGSDAVGDAQGREGALELRVSLPALGGGAVAEEGQSVGVEGGGRAVLLDGAAQVGEVAPGGIAGGEGAGDDSAGVVVEGEQEGGIGVGGPPEMGGGVVLPEFADGGALPAATGFGPAFGRGASLGEVLADIGGKGGPGTMEVQTAGQLVGQQGEVEGLAVGQKVDQEAVGCGGPVGMMIPAGGLESEVVLVAKPLMAQFVEASAADHQALGGGGGVELAGIEGGQDLLDVERLDPVNQLFLFIGWEGSPRGRGPQTPEVYRMGALVERDSARKPKTASGGLKPLAEPLNPGAAGAAQVALPQSPILRRSVRIEVGEHGGRQNKKPRNEEIRFCSNISSGFDLTILSGFVPPPTAFSFG